uniref:CTP_transf_like domain-containing protein n=1 Tax=Panagrellus redivivus TaxID=6233 RepID=A0A7E4VBD0_PANRE
MITVVYGRRLAWMPVIVVVTVPRAHKSFPLTNLNSKDRCLEVMGTALQLCKCVKLVITGVPFDIVIIESLLKAFQSVSESFHSLYFAFTTFAPSNFFIKCICVCI